MKLNNLRYFAFILPLSFLVLTLVYKDSFYGFLGVITFLLSVLIALPKLFSDKKISVSKLKHKLPSIHKKPSGDIKTAFNDLLKNRETILFILFATILFTGLFIFNAINLSQVIPNIKNFIIEYYLSLLNTLKINWFVLLALFLVTILIGSKFQVKENSIKLTKKLKFKNIIKKLIVSFAFLTLSFFISLVFVYLVGIFQLNSAVLVLKSNQNAVGVISDKNKINAKLKSMSSFPKIIGVNVNPTNAILSTVVNGDSINNSFYQEKIMNSIPHTFVIPLNINNAPVVLVNNTLIISSIDKSTMQTISPTLAHLLLANYFKNRNLKGDPVISILNRQEYLAFRQKEIDQQVAVIQNAIQKANNALNTLQSDAGSVQSQIANDNSIISNAQDNENTAYNNCTSSSYTDFFTDTVYSYTQDYCNSIKVQYEAAISQGQQDVNQLNGKFQYYEGQISDAQNAIQVLQSYEDSVNSQKDSTPDELGLFEPTNQVRVVLDSTSPSGIDDFLETLVHENLHYQSFVATDRCFHFSDGDGTCDAISYDSFWEEGLTEYFARKVIAKDLGVQVNQGYPLIVKIVSQIASKIPESELQRIYFTKDESTLEADLDSAYGNGFYKDTENYFESMSYLPADQQLKIANNIMTRIGGQELSENDLYSTNLQQE